MNTIQELSNKNCGIITNNSKLEGLLSKVKRIEKSTHESNIRLESLRRRIRLNKLEIEKIKSEIQKCLSETKNLKSEIHKLRKKGINI